MPGARPIAGCFGVALVLAPAPGPRTLARIERRLLDQQTEKLVDRVAGAGRELANLVGEQSGSAVARVSEAGSELAEKVREDEIRSLGWEVVRVTTPLLDERTELIRRVNAALSRANQRRAR